MKDFKRYWKSNDINTGLCYCVTAIFLCHCIMCINGKIPFVCMLITGGFIWIFYIIMSLSFIQSIRSEDFTLIAGYKKDAEPLETTRKKLVSIHYLSGLMALTCELLFFSVYVSEQKIIICIIISGAYVFSILLSNIIVKYKYGKR